MQSVIGSYVPVHPESAGEVTIALGLLHAAHGLAEEISRTSCHGEVLHRVPLQLVLHIHRLVAIDGGDDACHGVVGAVHVIVVRTIIIGCEHVVPVLAVETKRHAVALVVVLGIAGIDIEGPRLAVALGDDVDDTAVGTAAIEG